MYNPPKNTAEFTDEQIANARKIVQHAQKAGQIEPLHYDEVYVGWVLFRNITSQYEFTFVFTPERWEEEFFGIYEELEELEEDLEDASRRMGEMSIWDGNVYCI